MRVNGFSTLLIIATAAAVSPAFGQARKDTKAAPPANEVRYFTSISGIMDDQADTVLKETRTAGKVTAAVLDVCYPTTPSSDRKDRFVAALTVDGSKLTGTTETIDGKRQVTINLVRKTGANGIAFEGKITIGDRVSNITSADNTDISEKEFKTGQEADDEIVASPNDYTSVSPEAVAVRLKPGDVTDFVKTLRGGNIEIALSSLLPSCTELRKGEQVVRLNIDPERAADFVARARSTPGVIAAGWTGGKLDMDRTVRFAAADWREGSRINRDKIAGTLTATLSKALSATPLTSVWNDDNGELKLTFSRPNPDLPGLNLTQTIEIAAMVAAEKPGNADRLVLWIGFPALTTRDESPGAKLKISDASDSNSDETAAVDEGDTVTAVAHALRAQRWDADSNSWK